MSLDLPIPDPIVIVAVKDRTTRVECFTDYGTDYRLVAHRQRVYLDAEGTVVKSEERPAVERRVSEVYTEEDAMQMLGSLRGMVDKWAEEDRAAAQAIVDAALAAEAARLAAIAEAERLAAEVAAANAAAAAAYAAWLLLNPPPDPPPDPTPDPAPDPTVPA